MSLVEKDRWRYSALRTIYEKTGGNESYYLSFTQVAREIGCPEEEIHATFQYLVGERLIKAMGIGHELTCFITHGGVVEVEASVRRPSQETEHFTTAVIQHYYGAVGAVQHGSDNSASVSQDGANLDLRQLIDALGRKIRQLPTAQRDAALVELEKLAAILYD